MVVREPPIELRLLGPLEVLRTGKTVDIGGGKPRALLADLALHLGEVVSSDRLIEDLWGGKTAEDGRAGAPGLRLESPPFA